MQNRRPSCAAEPELRDAFVESLREAGPIANSDTASDCRKSAAQL